ncbi:AfsA-related hotdog domain-containing protein [Streptomyces coeruleorubidus]|uniref:AfsA-related hotdog domain-containing protein n=1 Tax=Streptomyces coeruleorubidus TaxID=116188 RepID=UPI0036A19F63
MDTVLALSRLFLGPQHLVHKPDSPEAFLLDAGTPVRQSFSFATELPDRHPLFSDTTTPFHDLLFPVEALRQAALFAARQYFRVPEKRITAVSATGVEITDVTPWRRIGEGSRLTLDLALTPVDVVTGVPRGLECEAAVSIDGRRCGAADARLVFLSPGVYRGHREAGRRQSEQSIAAGWLVEPAGVPAPEQVGHRDPRHVLVALSAEGEDGDEELLFPVDGQAAEAVLADGSGEVPPALFLEASRQAALLAAAELHGFVPSHALLTRWQAAFRGFAEPGLPLYCAVGGVSGADGTGPAPVADRDAAGRPSARLGLTFRQGDREVARVSVTVLQDC